MFDKSKMGKLTVGDIAEYEEWRRENRKKELVAITKDLYGDKVPANSLSQIEQELKKIPNIMNGDGFDLKAAQYLFWKSLKKNDQHITFEQVGDYLSVDNIEEYSQLLFPTDTNIESDGDDDMEKKSDNQIQ